MMKLIQKSMVFGRSKKEKERGDKERKRTAVSCFLTTNEDKVKKKGQGDAPSNELSE